MENKIRFFAENLGSQVVFDGNIYGELRGVSLDGLFQLEVIEEWDNNTPIYKKWAVEDTKLVLPVDKVTHGKEEWIYRINNLR